MTRRRSAGSYSDVTYRESIRTGQWVGAAAFLAGLILCILGLAGSVELLFEGAGLKARLGNASPGLIIALLGFLVLWRYKARVKLTTRAKQFQSQSEGPSGTRTISSSNETYETRTQGSRLSSWP